MSGIAAILLPQTETAWIVGIGDCVVSAVSVDAVARREHDPVYLARMFGNAERERLHGLRLAKRRREWMAGRVSAKAALQHLHAQSGAESPLHALVIGNSSAEHNRGQPQAAGGHVSISHSQGYAVAAASAYPVGIDIERVRPFPDAAREMAFTAHESRLSAAGGDAVLTAVWAFKEAFMKAHGKSIFGWFADIELEAIGGDGRLSWRLSPRLLAQLPGSQGTQLSGYGALIGDYALALVGQCVSHGDG
ncbi:4'-phosphopantetheinyl transferase family protein [Massilia aquatica]|uniref:4'-phosphopantetheinyl transferase superfamily protein n=1 Tax=Massilia aquatica TaxID=2609000 RepID=A0ABX0MPU8_9BURK|nr:4'-phosphopantetheinyl transferase family protein [Massilia aquatica]NHZ44241.1 4'-phosphopantetheinyl transferase superfamily protein [Massilia aquatica]